MEAAIPFKFNPSAEFPQAWKRLKLRPAGSAKGDARGITDERYCFYDAAHGDYIYTQACVDMLIKKCATEAGFKEVVGRDPRPKIVERPLVTRKDRVPRTT